MSRGNIVTLLKNKYNNLSIVAKAAMWFTVCTFIQKGIAMITTPIFTRVMSKDEYGLLTVYNSWVLLVDIIATMEFSQGVFNKGMIKYKDDKDGFTSSILILTSILTIIVGLLFLVFDYYFSGIIQLERKFIVLMFLQIFFQAPLTYWTARNKFDYNYKSVVVVSLTSSIIATVLSLLFVLNFNSNKTFYKVLGTLIVSVCINTFLYFIIIKNGKKIIEVNYWKYCLFFNIPLIPHFLSQQVLSQSDRIMISNFCGKSDAALYSVAYTFGSVLLLVLNALQSSFIPWTYRKVENDELLDVRKRSSQIFIVGGVICLMFPLLAPEFIFFLGGSSYQIASYVVPPISMSVLFTLMYSLFCNIEMYFEKTKYVMVASCLAAILNIVLNAIFIPKYGFIAAGYTTVFCYAILALFHNIMLYIICKQKSVTMMFNIKVMWIISAVFSLVSVSIVYLYPLRLIRYLVIAIVVMAFMVLHKYKIIDFKEILKKE